MRQAFLAAALGVSLLAAININARPEGDYYRSSSFVYPIRSVELQYYRVPPERWDGMIRRMAQYHADTISTYVHWGFHEYEEGKFDFTGETMPQRDLVRFIELCHQHGLFVILKPGPFIDAETNAGGIPQWLFTNYPETIAINQKGEPYIHGDSGMPRLSYLHPTYLQFVERYYHELGKATARLQWPAGPITAVQVDNETPGDGFVNLANYLSYNFKADYNKWYKQTGWPLWLEAEYRDIESLNRAYASSYQSFAQVPMLSEWTNPKTESEFQIYIDLDRFAEYQYVEALRRMRAMLVDAGFYAPMYQDLLCMPWDMAGLLGDMGGMAEAVGGWIGSNVYAEVYRPWTIFVGNLAYKYNWDEYVHMAVWRTALSDTLSEPYPAFIPEISCSQRFYFQAPVAWGADAVNIYVGWQTPQDNQLVAPKSPWGMEACVTDQGEVRDCFWNGKNTFMFMRHAGIGKSGEERPDVAIGYSHQPEHAWNWEFKFNFDRPHQNIRHPDLEPFVKGTNTGDRAQLIARQFVERDYDFDALHLDHLKPGQIERYKLLIVPVSPQNPAPDGPGLVEREGGYTLYLEPGDDNVDVDFFMKKGVRFSRAEAGDARVDATQRHYNGGPDVLSIVNRGAREFEGPVSYNWTTDVIGARLGPKAIGFVSVMDGGLRAAVIDHPKGKGYYRAGNDYIAFTGTFAAVAAEDGFIMASALDSGTVSVEKPGLPKPSSLVRVYFDGRREDAPFTYQDGKLSFLYDAGQGPDRTDVYVALMPGVSLENAAGDYLDRVKPLPWEQT